jgi:hypothetical protein
MSAANPRPSNSQPMPAAVQTQPHVDSPANQEIDSDASMQWQQMIDNTLRLWRQDPGRLEDEGLEAPSIDTIDRAIAYALEYQRRGRPAPTAVIRDPNGGIVFERRESDTSEQIHFWDDGEVDYLCFHGTNLVERQAAVTSPSGSLVRNVRGPHWR